MRPDHDPIVLTSEERCREVARILAAGVLRMVRRPACAPDPGPQNPQESSANGLALPGETVLSVHTG